MEKYKNLKELAKAKGVKTATIVGNTPPHKNGGNSNPFANDCPMKFPCIVIDKDKNMKIIYPTDNPKE